MSDQPVARKPAPPSGGLVSFRLGLGEWLFAIPPDPGGPEEELESLALRFARQHPPAGGRAPASVERLSDKAIDPRLGLVLSHLCGHRMVLYCSEAHVTEHGAKVLSALAGVIGLPGPGGAGPRRVELERAAHQSMVDDGLHPSYAFGETAGGATLIRARVCAGLVTSPEAADMIGRLWSQQPGYAAATPDPAGGAGWARTSRAADRGRRRAGSRQVRS